MQLPHWLRATIHNTVALLPQACAACEAPLRAAKLFCDDCARGVSSAPLAGTLADGTRWFARSAHTGAAATAIHRLKYRGRTDIARRLAQWFDWRNIAAFAMADCLVPVPLHPRRLAERGFNQAALIAAALAKASEIPSRPLALRRITYTVSQARLDRRGRLFNVRGHYAARTILDGMRVLLVDDVLTTGATASACIEALHEAGAHTLAVLAITRGGRDVALSSGAYPEDSDVAL
jgi:ComF family protein